MQLRTCMSRCPDHKRDGRNDRPAAAVCVAEAVGSVAADDRADRLPDRNSHKAPMGVLDVSVGRLLSIPAIRRTADMTQHHESSKHPSLTEQR